MINFEIILDFIITYLSGNPTISSYCVGYSWPATQPEIFLCFPGKLSVMIAILGCLVWWILFKEIIYGTPSALLKKWFNPVLTNGILIWGFMLSGIAGIIMGGAIYSALQNILLGMTAGILFGLTCFGLITSIRQSFEVFYD